MFPIVLAMMTKYLADSDASKRQNSLQQAMSGYQRSQAAGNEAAIGKLIDQQTPDARAAQLKSIQDSRTQSMQGAVDAARSAAPVTTVAGGSSDFQRAKQGAADTVASRTKRAIQQFSMMGAPGEQAVQSGIRFGRAAGTVDAGNQAIGNVGNAFLNAIKNTVPDPMLNLAADGLMAVGGAQLGKPDTNATVNNGQGYEDASGNLYSKATTRSKVQNSLANWGYR